MIGKIEDVFDNCIIMFIDIYFIDFIMREYEEEYIWIKIYVVFFVIDKCWVLIIVKLLIECIKLISCCELILILRLSRLLNVNC